MEVKRVEIYLELCGDYVAFHEITANVLYDLTNGIMVDEDSYENLEEIERAIGDSDYCDIQLVDALLVDGEYYYQI